MQLFSGLRRVENHLRSSLFLILIGPLFLDCRGVQRFKRRAGRYPNPIYIPTTRGARVIRWDAARRRCTLGLRTI